MDNRLQDNQIAVEIDCGEDGEMGVTTAYNFHPDFDREAASGWIDMLAGLHFVLKFHPEVLGTVGAMHRIMMTVGQALDEEGEIDWDDDFKEMFANNEKVVPIKKKFH